MDAPSETPVTVVVVDVANVIGAAGPRGIRGSGGVTREAMGAGPEGGVPPGDRAWWRDRPGAALRLYEEIAELAGRVAPTFVLVLEGQAREAEARIGAPHPGVRVISAARSGDDSIVTETASLAACGESCLVVTADRELRRRCAAEGASVVGPSWLLGQL
ncbi:MAG: hypothetical protein J2P26_08630 [Nocardiopsaceae bacterium]|nr:hypothetical protein [Nocardiopsaceae bacterium]